MKTPSGAKPSMSRLSDRIRSARRSARISQTALAEYVGVTPSAVAQWEHPDGTHPGVDRLQGIAAATGVGFEWLATGRGNQRRTRSGGEPAAALTLDSYAQDYMEEVLLERFRALPLRTRELLSSFLAEIKPGRR
jgi:transcriptional regulator with XRE-family HTH domain